MAMVSQTGSLRSFTDRRPRAILKWDSAQNKVVAHPFQVGISISQASVDLRSITSCPHSHPPLVDAFAVPEELLELSNLNDILSVETWENCLTRSEREILSMYLPEGVDPESTVDALLSGENFYFGNPFDTWGEAVCAGAMHPDAISHREYELKEQRKAYSKFLRSYHGKMVQNLQNMKQVWEQCENPDDFLPQIRRFGTSGRISRGNLTKHLLRPPMKSAENADSRKRHHNHVEELTERAREDVSIRPKAKKQRVNNQPEEGLARQNINPEYEMANFRSNLSEGPNRPKIMPTGQTSDFPIRAKGGKVDKLEERTKAPKIKASELEAKRLQTRSPEGGGRRFESTLSQETSKKVQLNSLQEETRKLKMKMIDRGVKGLQMKPSDEAAKRSDRKVVEEELKEPKLNTSGEVLKKLRIKPPEDARKKPGTGPAEDGTKLEMNPVDDRKDFALRPTGKRMKVKPSEEGMKRKENEHIDRGTKKSQIKMSDAPRNTQDNSSREVLEPLSRPKAKGSKVKPPEELGTQRLKTQISVDEPKSLVMKHPREEPKGLKLKSSEERTKTQQVRTPRGGKGLKFKPIDEEMQRPKLTPQKEKLVPPSKTKEKRSKVETPLEGTKKSKIKHTKKEMEEHDHGPSDLEGEWFQKYVQVTIGPVSGQKLSKAIQSVQVTAEMFKDVKRRSEAGEEVHLDTLVPEEAPSKNKKASKKAIHPSGKDEKIIANFWRTVLIKELRVVHARFMQRKDQLQKLAKSLASSCKNLWELELSNDEVALEDASPSGVDASPSAEYDSASAGFASPGEGYSSPSVGEPSMSGMSLWTLSGRQASPDGSEASPSGGRATPSGPSASEASASGGASSHRAEVVPSGEEAVQSEHDVMQTGDEAWQTGDEAVASGDEAVPSGDDDTVGSGDENSPSEVEKEESWSFSK